MDDNRAWKFEESVWLSEPAQLPDVIDADALFIVPAPPFIMTGAEAIQEMAQPNRWTRIAFSEQRIHRPQEGIIVLAYHANAQMNDGNTYEAYCTSTLHRLAHERWQLVQHQQTPPPATD